MTHSSTDMEDAQRQAILAKLTEFNARCEALIALLADKRHVTHYDRTELEARYRSLKDDMLPQRVP